MAKIANGDFNGEGAAGVPGWFENNPTNDFRYFPTGKQRYQDILFEIVNPAENGRKACLLLSDKGNGFVESAVMPVNKKAASVYFLHTCTNTTNTGIITLEYTDGTKAIDYIDDNKISKWYLPPDFKGERKNKKCVLGWWGANDNFTNIGCMIYGYDNPNPEKEIKNIHFNIHKNDGIWGVLGVTLCDASVFFNPDFVSFGIPDNWGAAAVTYALLEGLAGVKDTGVAFDKALLAPRWESANVNKVKATVKYEASGGYLSYEYKKSGNTISILTSGNAKNTDIEVLIPVNSNVGSVKVNNDSHQFNMKKVENSNYCCFKIAGLDAKTIEIALV